MSHQPDPPQDEPILTYDLPKRLTEVSLFDGIKPKQLALITEHATVRHFQRDEIISEQQSTEQDLYIVLRGHIQVWLDSIPGENKNTHKLATLYADECAGELALVDGGVRSATLQAGDEGATVLVIPRLVIISHCDADTGFGYQLMRNLASMLALRQRLTTLHLQDDLDAGA